MKRTVLSLAALVLASPALAAASGVTLTGPDNQYTGTDASPLVTRPAAGAQNAKVDQGVAGSSPWSTADANNAALTPQTNPAGTGLVVKFSAGSLYGFSASNLTATAAFVLAIDAAAVPASGTAIAPKACVNLPANGPAGEAYPGPPDAYATGITVLVSTSCTTYTPASLAAFIKGRAR